MATITIQTSDNYGQKLYQRLKADKNLSKIILREKNNSNKINEIEIALPGPSLEDRQLLASVIHAAKGKSLSINEAREKSYSKIAAWRKNK